VIVLHIEGQEAPDDNALRERVASEIFPRAVPSVVMRHPKLPRLASGKVDMATLATAYRRRVDETNKNSSSTSAASVNAETALSQRIIDVASRTLKTHTALPLTLDAEMGSFPQWDSFGHINLALALEKEFAVRFEFNELSQARKLTDFKVILERKIASR
jgi:acyl carrier protein